MAGSLDVGVTVVDVWRGVVAADWPSIAAVVSMVIAAISSIVAIRARRDAKRSADAAERLVTVEQDRDRVAGRPRLSVDPVHAPDDRVFVWLVNEGDRTIDHITLRPTSASPALRFEGDNETVEVERLEANGRSRVYFHRPRHVAKYKPVRLIAHCQLADDEWDQPIVFNPPKKGPLIDFGDPTR
ncbi:hypothetical protein [Euzebya sp.]|uniref:hypothetical protein n=1 Tax=Euzebya sp. TaxID=1971409 RepID=UPI00355AA548